jgi:hypothetical protein
MIEVRAEQSPDPSFSPRQRLLSLLLMCALVLAAGGASAWAYTRWHQPSLPELAPVDPPQAALE